MHARHALGGVLVAASLALCLPAAARRPAPAQDPRRVVLQAMEAELDRAAKELKIGDHPPPYFVGYLVRETESIDLQARYGAIFRDDRDRQRSTYVEVRVGSYELDNSGKKDEGFFGSASRATYISDKSAPLENDVTALRASLWLSTDEKYKEALSDYLKKRGDRVYDPEEKRAPSFSRETPVHYVAPRQRLDFDRARWRSEIRQASQELTRAPEIFDNFIRVGADKTIRWIANTEGTRIIDEDLLYSLHITAVARAEDGMLLTHSRSFYGRSQDDLPHGPRLRAEVDRLERELLALRKAPVMDPYTGPAILEPEATGVLFHEAIGHRLEGERQDDEESGRTFKGQIGVKVVPEFLSVYDDPTLPSWQGRPLNGYYSYDDEGVAAQRAKLIEHGVLTGYLLSRSPVKGVPPKSNGHGRSQGTRDPMARMANLIVRADPKSQKVVDRRTLEKRLLEEARRQGKRYALIIADIAGGDTNTSGYGYQAFRGKPTLVYRIDVETGEKQLVRGVELVGTPLTVINKIVAASNETDVFNGYCGAESGYVPVSTVAPATLITEVELQRQRREAERPPVLPPPWAH
ncbi:MAG: TldD/PmbA family protein [Deltaproteobacteria bacterium]|nr:MAG: TldD/PmbA family protein [Deltaproteobacteria bacterium]